MERRLAAILITDMVGYSRMMASDEADVFARQQKLRLEVVDPKIAEYGGRIIKSTGDGVLVMFRSAVDAISDHSLTFSLKLRRATPSAACWSGFAAPSTPYAVPSCCKWRLQKAKYPGLRK